MSGEITKCSAQAASAAGLATVGASLASGQEAALPGDFRPSYTVSALLGKDPQAQLKGGELERAVVNAALIPSLVQGTLFQEAISHCEQVNFDHDQGLLTLTQAPVQLMFDAALIAQEWVNQSTGYSTLRWTSAIPASYRSLAAKDQRVVDYLTQAGQDLGLSFLRQRTHRYFASEGEIPRGRVAVALAGEIVNEPMTVVGMEASDGRTFHCLWILVKDQIGLSDLNRISADSLPAFQLQSGRCEHPEAAKLKIIYHRAESLLNLCGGFLSEPLAAICALGERCGLKSRVTESRSGHVLACIQAREQLGPNKEPLMLLAWLGAGNDHLGRPCERLYTTWGHHTPAGMLPKEA